MARLHIVALLIAALVAIASASSAPTFCKCTCFKNSTIIPLGPAGKSGDSSTSSSLRRSISLGSLLGPRFAESSAPTGNSRRSASSSCSECTKAFCLSQGISFCKDAKEENVVTMCFQRDSNKDKIIVWGFILGTTGLLGWTAFKRMIEWREGRAMGRQDISYAPVTSGGQ
ncbi:hypothetical protein JDV02_008656 [Purpureocillium takamizusanense]|uniref:MFS transporter n=1 Tax=Purpureocillium takamizusanense TaxID=2060973 RepID=A0A9Q8VFH9_9HYPO|nr:uncharacterized protein JDV02_008656 [Purpureocillium takamizusanense]UNI22802.1 hypothetical protein JDV02_008656 [Purpureocillium takamizusanense]